jgi:hypothetical protein
MSKELKFKPWVYNATCLEKPIFKHKLTCWCGPLITLIIVSAYIDNSVLENGLLQVDPSVKELTQVGMSWANKCSSDKLVLSH